MQTWLIYAALSALFAALVGIVGKIGVQEIDSITATAIRAVIMAILSVFFAVGLKKTDLSGIDAKALGFIALAGLFGAMSWMAYFKALSVGEASRVIPVDRSSVLIAVILAWLILGERITLKTSIGVILITIGTILVSL
ncbi:MAG: EamA family transporter [Thermoproteota archaeon]|nr:MAG: EamA family transporter [Candidatus Korarchaeota archaeon]RLG49295.1 MAG: EamA family transporter [Candidatus Korarchaeota archaeon]